MSCGVCDAFGWQDLIQDNQKHLKVKVKVKLKLKLKVDLMLEKNLKMKESLKQKFEMKAFGLLSCNVCDDVFVLLDLELEKDLKL